MKSFKKFVVESIEQEELDEAVEVRHDRYMRSHRKKASGGTGSWMFTHKAMGDVDYNNPKEVHSANGKFSDAKKSAQQWAKKHGHSTVYVMEEVELDEAFDLDVGAKVAMKSKGKMIYGKVIGKEKVMGKPGVEVQWSSGSKGRFSNNQFAALSMDKKADYVISEEVELDEAVMQGSKEHLKKLQGMLDKVKPGSVDHSQIRGAIESKFGKQHIPAKHRNVKPDMYEEVELDEASIEKLTRDRNAVSGPLADRRKEALRKKIKDARKAEEDKIRKDLGLDEKLKASDDMGTWVKDFQDSDAPQFKGKSQKKRQQMAIAAKLAAERNEEVELDEVSNTTLQRYKSKAGKVIDNSENEREVKKRGKGYALASRKLTDRLTKEEVELDEAEMSLYDKIKAARANPSPDKPVRGRGSKNRNPKTYDIRNTLDKEDDRLQGMVKKKLKKEEVELDEAETKYVIKHKKTKQVLNTHDDYATAKDEHEGLGADKKDYGVYKQTKKDAALRNRNTYREEVQLDELSPSTLRSYSQKASDSERDLKKKDKEVSSSIKKVHTAVGKKHAAQMAANRATNQKDMNKATAAFRAAHKQIKDTGPMLKQKADIQRKRANRMDGLARASDRLRREEVELDEQKMTFQNAEKLKNKHLVAMDHHKKSGNSKGYVAHSMVVDKFEDAYDRHGTFVIPAGRILAASQKAFKDHPHSGMKESVELDEVSDLQKAFIGSMQSKLKKRSSLRDPNAKAAREEDKLAKKLAAKEKMKKEEVELDEVSTEKLRDYASAALQDKDKAKADKRWKYASKAMKTVGDREAKAAHFLKYNNMEEVELDEKLATHIVRGDTYVGVPDRVVAQAKDKVKKMNPSTASDHQKAINKVLSDMGWEMTAGGKYVREEVNESNDMKMVRLGQKMLDLAPKEKNDMISNAYSKLGDALTRYGTNFGPKNVKDLEKKTGLNQRIIMDLMKRAQVKESEVIVSHDQLSESELELVYEETERYLTSENINVDDLTEEQLDEIIGRIIKGTAKLAYKGAKSAIMNKQGNLRFSTAGRADAIQKKADKLEKAQRDRERLRRQRQRLQALQRARSLNP